jgi:CRP/FNR family transcriptional regulator
MAVFGVAAHRPPLVLQAQHRPSICDSCGVRASNVCDALGYDDLHRLAAVARVVEVAAGRTFIVEGDPADSFFNLTDGTVKLYKLMADGRRQITGFLRKGDFLGLAVSSGYAFSAAAINDVRYCRYSRGGLRGVLDDFPALEKRLMEVASNELVEAQEQMLLLGRKTAKERVASFLLAQSRRTVGYAARNPTLTLPMPRGDIADYLGLAIETVSRIFTQLKHDQVIAIPTIETVIIFDHAGLLECAGS